MVWALVPDVYRMVLCYNYVMIDTAAVIND